jgi:hypothetical protein
LEAGESAKQAYWDGQDLPGDEAKVVPDLPVDAVPISESGKGRSKLLIMFGTILLLGAGAAAYFVL